MTWELPLVLLLVVLVRIVPPLLRRKRRLFGGPRSRSVPTVRVEVARTLERRKRAALDAATGVLR